MHFFTAIDDEYSPDVEFDERGDVVFARNCMAGEIIKVPRHMMAQVLHQCRKR